MTRPFNPRPKRCQEKGRRQRRWIVDCRTWGPLMEQLGEPQRKRFRSEAEAEAYCRELLVAEATGKKRVAHRDKAHAYLDRFRISYEGSRRADGTKRTYTTAIGAFEAWLRGHEIVWLDDITPLVVEQYRDSLYETHKDGTVLQYMRVLHTAFAWGVKMLGLSYNPVRGLVPKAVKSRRRALTHDEREAILNGTTGWWRDVWMALLYTGLRRSELAGLRLDQVELDTPAPYLEFTGKGGKVRVVPLEGEAIDCFARLLDAAPTHGPGGRDTVLGVGDGHMADRWRAERRRLGLPEDITLHTFRHDFATYIANLPEVPITEVRDVMGHSSVVITEIYVHKDERKLRLGMAQRSKQIGTELAPRAARACSDGVT